MEKWTCASSASRTAPRARVLGRRSANARNEGGCRGFSPCDESGLFLLAQDDRGLAATALGGWDGRRGWLYHVAVRPDQRRHGLGGRLVRIIEERLWERGCPKVNLIVWDDNTAAMDFWAATGYTRAATVEFEKEL